jgi:ribosomal protein S18 acetylase RimI-like enzyme
MSLARIDDYLHTAPRTACDAVPSAGFVLYLNRQSDSPWFSYARPLAEAPPDPAAAVAEAVARFRAAGRAPRWEWVAETAPWLESALNAAGWTCEPTPLLTVTPERFRPEEPAGFRVRAFTAAEPGEPLIRAQRRAFDLPDEAPSAGELALKRAWLARGGAFTVAESPAGEILGVGGHLPLDGVTEIAGIGTVPAHRRRGVGGAVSTALIRDAFARGCDLVFLTCATAEARRLYERLGFRFAAHGMMTAVPDEP